MSIKSSVCCATTHLRLVVMRYRRICPVCSKPNLLRLPTHLAQVHGLNADQRHPLLQAAEYVNVNHAARVSTTVHQKQRECPSKGSATRKRINSQSLGKPQESKKAKSNPEDVLITLNYPEFRFQHLFSLLCIAPSQAGKTYLIRQILENNHITYPETLKKIKIKWFYGQWQKNYEDMQKSLGNKIKFCQGLPKYKEDLSDIDPRFNNIIVLDDLMDLAKDSPIVAKLFTQGRHRNASVLLLLQNAFPKGKYNTDISRNAQYIIMFGSPSDRKQIGIVAERVFDKNRNAFMDAYNKITSVPYRYVVIDNKPDTPSDRQVLTDIFGTCKAYPFINGEKKKNCETVSIDGIQQKKSSNPRGEPADEIICQNKSKRSPGIDLTMKWLDTPIKEWQPVFQNAPKEKEIPNDYQIHRLYNTSQNENNPSVSVNSFHSRWTNHCVWPVQLKHVKTGHTKHIFLSDRNEELRKVLTKHGINPI